MAHVGSPDDAVPAAEASHVSWEELPSTIVDDTLWGRDPFDVIAALEDELGHSIYSG